MKTPYRLAQNPPQLARFSFSAVLTLYLPQTDSHICERGLYVWPLPSASRFVEKDRDKALQIYHDTLTRQDDYLIAGEVRGDLSLMKNLLEKYDEASFTNS